MVDIPADAGKGFGAWETLHEAGNGAEFARQIEAAAGKYYGVPLRAFLAELVKCDRGQLNDWFRNTQVSFSEALPADVSGQARRVVSRFTLVALAGELATLWGVTGWQTGEARAAALACFSAWLDARGGAGKQEDTEAVELVRGFVQQNDAAFDLWHRVGDDHAPRSIKRAGMQRWLVPADGEPVEAGVKGWGGERAYVPVKTADDLPDMKERQDIRREYFFYREQWRDWVCKGRDAMAVAVALAEKGVLRRGDNKHLTRLVSIPGQGRMRVYHILSSLLDDDGEQEK
ncbi:hypothetical protein AGMMS49543_14090 [Betaproteobacteria bacterium]|nr:hypothetical protein AGMMS49543_14090 [Betaproteobacteria bacterium]GHU06588.1 hypothetical protein AGMMS50225_01980 [Betaproteobacteria bacterium]GHU20884.1 hypothetical protein AGMMS50243_17090 [Betaproteobacteria bacterium]